MENHGEDRPLFAIAKSWKGLQGELGEGQAAALRLGSFTQACSLISPLFGCLGVAFKFAEKDYVKIAKPGSGSSSVGVFRAWSLEDETPLFMIYVEQRRTMPRCRRWSTKTLEMIPYGSVGATLETCSVCCGGVDMVRVLFEHILVTEGNSLKEPASKAYEQVFAPHHGWTIRKAVDAGMFLLPTKAQFLKKLHEEEDSAQEHIQEFVKSAGSVVQYVNDMYVDKEIGTDW